MDVDEYGWERVKQDGAEMGILCLRFSGKNGLLHGVCSRLRSLAFSLGRCSGCCIRT